MLLAAVAKLISFWPSGGGGVVVVVAAGCGIGKVLDLVLRVAHMYQC